MKRRTKSIDAPMRFYAAAAEADHSSSVPFDRKTDVLISRFAIVSPEEIGYRSRVFCHHSWRRDIVRGI